MENVWDWSFFNYSNLFLVENGGVQITTDTIKPPLVSTVNRQAAAVAETSKDDSSSESSSSGSSSSESDSSDSSDSESG